MPGDTGEQDMSAVAGMLRGRAVWIRRGHRNTAWPPLVAITLLRGRRAHDAESATPARLRRAAYWFWIATAYC